MTDPIDIDTGPDPKDTGDDDAPDVRNDPVEDDPATSPEDV